MRTYTFAPDVSVADCELHRIITVSLRVERKVDQSTRAATHPQVNRPGAIYPVLMNSPAYLAASSNFRALISLDVENGWGDSLLARSAWWGSPAHLMMLSS